MKLRTASSPLRHNRSHNGIQPLAQLLLIIVAIATIVILATWLSRPAPPKPQICVGFDVSASHVPAERKRDFGAVLAAVDSALPAHSPLHLWAFDYDARKFYDGKPERSQDLWPVEDSLTNYKSLTRGTRPSEALRQMLPALARANKEGKQSAIVLVWDGGAETDAPALQKAVAQLAQMPGICAVWLVGVKSDEGLRSDVDRIFAPFGSRLIVSGPLDMQSGLDALRERLRDTKEGQR